MGWLEKKPGGARHLCKTPALTHPFNQDALVAGVGSTWQCDEEGCGQVWIIGYDHQRPAWEHA
jgi:hypothetical protein